MGIFTDLVAKHDTGADGDSEVWAAARELGRGLMRGNRPELKLGYTAGNAEIAARDAAANAGYTLVNTAGNRDAGQQRAELVAHLLGFGAGMSEEDSEAVWIRFRERFDRKAEVEGIEVEPCIAAFEEGDAAGRAEDTALAYPAELAL